MVIRIILALLFSVQCGHAAYYNEGVMEWVVAVRQANQGWEYPLPQDLPPVVDFVAVPECDRIGELLAIWHESEGWNLYMIADCANQIEGHDEQMRRKGIVVEVGYNTAVRWGVIGFGPEHIDVAVIEWDTLRSLWRESHQASQTQRQAD